jgi:hypothetical protein
MMWVIGVVAFALVFLLVVWRVTSGRPNEGWERDDSLYPNIGEAIPPNPSSRPSNERDDGDA